MVPDNATKPDMAGAGINRLGITRRWSIALAIFFGAKMRSAFEHFAGYANGIGFHDAAPARSTTRICGNAAGACPLLFNPGLGKPVVSPFPDIADHVEYAVTIGRIAVHWRRAQPSVG